MIDHGIVKAEFRQISNQKRLEFLTNVDRFALLLLAGRALTFSPMLDPELLAMLVCPETHLDLLVAGPDEIARLNEAIRAGDVSNVGKKEVAEPVDGALIRVDRAIAYPIRDEIPVMLVEEGLDIRRIDLGFEPGVLRNG